MNMGLIIVLVTISYGSTTAFDVSNLTFLAQGIYNDVTSEWYLNIGIIIILTLTFNIIMPFL